MENHLRQQPGIAPAFRMGYKMLPWDEAVDAPPFATAGPEGLHGLPMLPEEVRLPLIPALVCAVNLLADQAAVKGPVRVGGELIHV